jgi:hypothetical protein
MLFVLQTIIFPCVCVHWYTAGMPVSCRCNAGNSFVFYTVYEQAAQAVYADSEYVLFGTTPGNIYRLAARVTCWCFADLRKCIRPLPSAIMPLQPPFLTHILLSVCHTHHALPGVM